MKKSIIAFVVFCGLGLAGMGALGGVIYFPVAPVLMQFFPPFGDWTGDWVWPATIIAGMVWSFSFLAAGFATKILAARGTRLLLRRATYVAILWLGALLVWAVILTGQFSGQ